LANEHLIASTHQLILLSAFFSGIVATFLAAVLVFEPKKAIANWIVYYQQHQHASLSFVRFPLWHW
jgi:hypothetical protein